MRKWKRMAALALAVLLTLPAGCGQREERMRFSAAVVGQGETFDPPLAVSEGEQIAVVHLYENLMRLQRREDGVEVVPAAARSYQCTDNLDGTETYTFQLRPDAKWSDGRAVRAGDFVYGWQHLVAAATNSPFAPLLNMVAGYEEARGGDPDALQVRAKDDSTLEVVLSCRCPYFLRSICTASATMPRRADLAGHRDVIGNGPYVWGDYTDGVLTLNAAETYYDNRRLGPGTLTIRYCATSAEAGELMERGEVDFACNVADGTIAEQEGWKLEPYPATTMLAVNQMAQQLRNRSLLQAMSLTIDRTALAETEGLTLCSAAEGLVPPGIAVSTGGAFRELGGPRMNNDDYEGNCAAAQKKLDGVDVSAVTDVTVLYEDTATNALLADQLRRDWQEQLGLSVRLKGVSPEELQQALFTGAFSVAMMTRTADRNDAESFLNMWRSADRENVARFHSNAYDVLLRVAASAADPAARDAYLADAEQLLLDQGNAIPLLFTSRAFRLRAGLTGLLSDGQGIFYFGGIRQAAS